jgi:hypothetical protein
MAAQVVQVYEESDFGVVAAFVELVAIVVAIVEAEVLELLEAEGKVETVPLVQERGRMRGRSEGAFAAGVRASRKPCGFVTGLVCV